MGLPIDTDWLCQGQLVIVVSSEHYSVLKYSRVILTVIVLVLDSVRGNAMATPSVVHNV